MVAPTWIITGENVKNVEGEDFQQFCFELLEFEVSYRHVGGNVSGPPKKYRHDKGMDLFVEILSAPRIGKTDFLHALTEDEPAQICVACKSGDNWERGLIEDARKPGPVEVVRGGGHFTMLVNRQVSAPNKSELVNKVIEVIENESGVTIGGVGERIDLFDANDLASFYAHHPIMLDARTRRMLGIPDLSGLGDLDEWRRFLAQRPWPEFSTDEPREGALRQLNGVLERTASHDREPRVVWVYGPPGVGKSRLVFEALRKDAGISGRVIASFDFAFGRWAVSGSEVPRYNDVILVIDECPPHEVASLCSMFWARGQGRNGTMILIGPQEGTTVPSGFLGLPLVVEPLQTAAARALVERELGAGSSGQSELVERVLRLTEGYPWFAVLLAQALQSDPEALPTTAGQWEAAELALAGPVREYGDDHSSWQREVLIRAKALLAVILTEGVDWKGLDEDVERRLGLALEASWPEIKEAANRCWKRGILRVRQEWAYKYVTPNNLARLVACHLLGPPRLVGRPIREHVPELREALYKRLEGFEVPTVLLQELAADELRPFFDEPSIDSVESLPLRFLARRQPGSTARLLRQTIEATGIDELQRRPDIRRDLVFALEHICRRKEGFEDAERALFRLAVAENETWANNATGVWSGLFLGALSLTHRSFEERLAILGDRVRNDTEQFRLVTLKGLEKAIGEEYAGLGFTADDQMDGEWPARSIREVQEGKIEAWRLLCDLTTDEVAAVASEARSMAIHNLRASVRWGIATAVSELLTSVVDEWTDQEKADLRESLNQIKRYEGDILEQDEDFGAAYGRLRQLVEPSDFHARLLDVVGRWFPGDAEIGAEGREEYEAHKDKELAREGLTPPGVPLSSELGWLDSEKAVRAAPFMFHAGMVDEGRVLLKPLVERAEGGEAKNTLSTYLAGLAEAGAQGEVDEVLRAWRGDASLALHTLLTVWRIGASAERVGWIIEDLRSGSLDPDAVWCLALGSWGQRAAGESTKRLIETLTEFPSTTPQVAALDLILDRVGAAPEEAADLEPALQRLVALVATKQVSGMAAHTWERGCMLCLQRGLVDAALEAAIAAIGSADRYGSDGEAWKIIVEVSRTDPVKTWNALASLIERREAQSYRIAVEIESHGIVTVTPPAVVMEWVGSDVSRSVIVALMCNVHTAPLNELARQLIIRFGPGSPAARELAARAHSTPHVVPSLAGFAKSQLENARQWAQDPDPSVAEWGKKLVETTQESYEWHAAREEFEEREWR